MLALTELPHTSSATAESVSDTTQVSSGIALVSVMLKANPWPGCSPGEVKGKFVTMSRAKTWLVNTRLVIPTLPMLVTVAVTISGSPGRGNGLVGQVLVKAMRGVVNTGQVAEIVALVAWPHTSVPRRCQSIGHGADIGRTG